MGIIIGADQTAATIALGQGSEPIIVWQPFVASASGQLTVLGVGVPARDVAGQSWILAVYDDSSPPNLLAQTAEFTVASGANAQLLQSAISITQGSTYNLALYTNSLYPQIQASGGPTSGPSTSLICSDTSSLTFPMLPNTLTVSGSGSYAPALAFWGSDGVQAQLEASASDVSTATGELVWTVGLAADAMDVGVATGALVMTPDEWLGYTSGLNRERCGPLSAPSSVCAAAPGGTTWYEIFPITAGSSGTLVINDCTAPESATKGNQLLSLDASQIVAGNPIEVNQYLRAGLTISSCPTGMSFMVSYSNWNG